jgi:hypothetical protein
MAYFVSWKGYPESENCWVSENDAGCANSSCLTMKWLTTESFRNAQDLIDDFWKKRKGDKKMRKPVEMKTPSKGRKSAAKDDGSDADSAAAPKKRGRKSNVRDSDADNTERPSRKKAKDSNKGDFTRTNPPDSEEDAPIGNMKKYMTVPSWEHLVADIDTVERTDNGSLDVYFRL